MKFRIFALLICLFGIAAVTWAGSDDAVFTEELDSAQYDCSVTLTPSAKVSPKSMATLDLEMGVDKQSTRITISEQLIRIESIQDRKKTVCGEARPTIKPGEEYRLVIMRRGEWLGLLQGDTLIFHGEVPRPTGAKGEIIAAKDWTIGDTRVQRLEPVAFADNFMRTADEPGSWVTQSGQWGLHSAWDVDPKGNANKFNSIIYSQNPFAWIGTSTTGFALCTTGKPYWEDYTMTAAILPSADTAAGVMVNMTDPKNGLLVRWSPGNDRGPLGDRLSLFQMVNGQTQLLAEDRGGFVPGQWYKLTVVSTIEGIQVSVDGRERINMKDIRPWRGSVGLYAEGKNGVLFDDITVYGHGLKKDLITENMKARINQRFIDDQNGMQEWANRSEWTMLPGTPSQRIGTWDYYGDHWITLRVHPFNAKNGELWLVLNSSGKEATSGYRAVMKLTDGDKLTYTIYRNSDEMVSKTSKPLDTTVDYSFRFWHVGNKLWLEQDGEKVLEATDQNSLTGQRPAYRAEGCFALAREVMVLGRNALDYSFSDAPVDWLQDGTWMQTTRWSCAPHWSFLGGWSRGNVALWHKQRVSGDQSFDAFVGVKMEYPRERDIYDNRYHDFAISICSDGVDPRTGYSGIFVATEPDGQRNGRSVLLRNGVEVASATVTAPNRGTSHRQWFELELHKRGDKVEFWIEGSLACTYTDPKPIDGGVPVIWSNDNGISVALARLHFTNPPQPRTDTRVIIDEPWYPEWSNVGKPVTLNFPETWSTSGRSVTLHTTQHMAPDGEGPAVTVQGSRVTYTPRVAGEHWYEVYATDGDARSQSYHIFGNVFDPARGRDDSHALVLYRFRDEDRFKDDKGRLMLRDVSKAGTPLNLSISQPDKVSWVPGQGMTVHSDSSVMTPDNAAKLMGIAKTRAATLEFWVSTDTIYPPIGWSGELLAWEVNSTDKHNFAVAHATTSLLFVPRGATYQANDQNTALASGFRTGLMHYVVAWDGNKTRLYINGKLASEKVIDWKADQWVDAPLQLGNQWDGQRTYLGTYYLVAIHDRCLSADDVLRHYEAGPSAQ